MSVYNPVAGYLDMDSTERMKARATLRAGMTQVGKHDDDVAFAAAAKASRAALQRVEASKLRVSARRSADGILLPVSKTKKEDKKKKDAK